MNNNSGGKGLIIVLCILFFLITYSCERSSHEKDIQSHITSINGEVISIEENIFHVGTPFYFSSKYDEIYKVVYKINDETKEGWVRFRTFGAD